MRRLMRTAECAICLLMLSAAATASTVAFWQFDEKAPGQTADTTAGAIIDQTGNHNATVISTGPQLYADGAPDYAGGSALNFNPAGTNALSVPNDAALQNLFADGTSGTIEAMIRTTSADWQRLINKQQMGTSGYWYLRLNNDGTLRFETVDTTYPSSGFINRNLIGVTPVNDGDWHHVALVVDSDTNPGQTDISVYVDYALDNHSLGSTVGDISNVADVLIGKRPDNVRFFNGDIDFIKISDTALLPSEMVKFEVPPPPALPKHEGLTDPTEGRFFQDGAPGTGVTDDLGVDAWNIAGGSARYRAILRDDELDEMATKGWSAKMMVRNLLTDDDATDWGIHLEASDRTHTYLLLVGSDDSDNPTLYYMSNISGYVREEIPLTGISGDGYHTYEMTYDPDSPGAVSVFVDDIFQASINGAVNSSSWKSRFCFGSTDKNAVADANYALVELKVVPEPCTLLLMIMLAGSFFAFRPRRGAK